MIFIIRIADDRVPPFDVKMARQTPALIADRSGQSDFFCLGDPDAARQMGWAVVSVHDGWYADDNQGGMAIWGQGMFWEVRDTPFTIKQACGPQLPDPKQDNGSDSAFDVRQAIFRG